MGDQTFLLEFPSASVATANKFADELRRDILDAHPDVEVDRQRSDPSTQDFGGTLVLVLGTPAAIAIAKAIGDWLKRHNTASITIKTPNGTLVGENLTNKTTEVLAELFFARR